MEKEYVINYEVAGSYSNCMQGVFCEESVNEEVKELLESMYGDCLEWYEIREL